MFPQLLMMPLFCYYDLWGQTPNVLCVGKREDIQKPYNHLLGGYHASRNPRAARATEYDQIVAR
jgi:hypothetical protein